ncbi:MAG TPA: hypothetical protein VF881_21185 [Polyangiaceae bacterium]
MNDSPASTIAYVALILWIPLSIAAFFLTRPERATVFVLLGALLFLPERVHFKFPYLPPLTKENIPYLCVLVGMLLRAPRRVLHLPRERWLTFLTLALLAGAIGTALTNEDTLRYGTYRITIVPGLTVKDGLFTGIDQALRAALPLYLGLAIFRTPRDLRDLLAGFAIAGLIYIPFTLVEMRMSPQFHYWVYGYHQHSFLQTMRWGGYRPMVFMSHGLALARFLVVAIMAALLVAPQRRTLLGIPTRVAAGLLFVALILCKSTAAIAYGVFAILLLVLGRVRLRQAVAIALAAVVVLYPALRAADLFPVTNMVSVASDVDTDRQQSLQFRFENEDALLAKARQRIVFGWGEYNRSAIFDDMGRPSSVTDGHWIVLFGILGAVGFASAFGMLLLPVFLARRRLRAIPDKSTRMLLAGTSLILGVIAIDLIPNGLFANYPYLMAGALMGVTRTVVVKVKQHARQTMLVRRAQQAAAVV